MIRRHPRLPRSAARRLSVAGAVLSVVILGGCTIPGFGAYPGATSQGREAFKLWQGFFVAGLVVFILVFILILWAIIRYRHRSDEIPRQNQYHTVFEIIYTVIPVIMVLALFGFVFVSENHVDAIKKPRVTVCITAFQWGWTFKYLTYTYASTATKLPKKTHGAPSTPAATTYGGTVTTTPEPSATPSTGHSCKAIWTNPTQTARHVHVLGAELQDPKLVLPAGETVQVTLRSDDVIHGFYVPQFDFSRYAQPGVINEFDMNVTKVGRFRGQCTQLCGLYHSVMIFQVTAVTPSKFATWVHTREHSPRTNDSITAAKAEIQGGGIVTANGSR